MLIDPDRPLIKQFEEYAENSDNPADMEWLENNIYKNQKRMTLLRGF